MTVNKIETCPTCGCNIKIKRRWMHKEMVKFLVKLNDITEARRKQSKDPDARIVVDSEDIIRGGHKKSTDAVYLVHWGLLEHPNKAKWVITDLGRLFVKGRVGVEPWKMFKEFGKKGVEAPDDEHAARYTISIGEVPSYTAAMQKKEK